jgi:hypothetical protein
MQYLGNIETGEVCASSNWDKLFTISRESAILNGLAVEITGKQKGEYKAILRKKDYEKGIFEFKAFTARSWREALEHKNQGWEMRKDYDFKTTFDEYPILGEIKNK